MSAFLDPFLFFTLLTAIGLVVVWRRNPGWRRGLLVVVETMMMVRLPETAFCGREHE